jgi:branched-chain amino acid transport system ATP-binding protein
VSEVLLQVDRLEMRFGGIVALHEVSLSARAGHVTAVIGPNGAGKTTLFNCITGMYRSTGGRIEFDGRTLSRMNPHEIARSGIARTFQNLALFEGLSVFENLKMGAYQRGHTGLLEGMIISPRARREEAEAERRARETLAFLGIEDVASKRPSELSYGMQKQVEFARALMQDARLILLDEPMAGMNQTEKSRLVDLILQVRDRLDVSFLLVEHDMPVVMGMSDHIVVLDFGRKIAEGEPQQVSTNEAVIAAYLGTELSGAAAS